MYTHSGLITNILSISYVNKEHFVKYFDQEEEEMGEEEVLTNLQEAKGARQV